MFWQILESLVEDGTLKGCSLGVSNYRPQDLEETLRVAKIKPVVNRMFPLSIYADGRNRIPPLRLEPY